MPEPTEKEMQQKERPRNYEPFCETASREAGSDRVAGVPRVRESEAREADLHSDT